MNNAVYSENLTFVSNNNGGNDDSKRSDVYTIFNSYFDETVSLIDYESISNYY